MGSASPKRIVRVAVTDEEATIINDMLNITGDQLYQTKDRIIEDPTVDEMDDLLSVVADVEQQIDTVNRVREAFNG